VENGFKLNSPSKLLQIRIVAIQSILGIASSTVDGLKILDNTHQSEWISCPHPSNKHLVELEK
jgi:hypothetical protein